MKPLANALQRQFNAQFGDLEELKLVATSIQDKTHELKEALMTIKELRLEIRATSAVITDLLETIPHTEALFTDYNELTQFLESWDFVNEQSSIDMLLELPMVLMAAIFSTGLAGAGITAAFSVVTAAVRIVSSVKQEHNIRNELRRVENLLNNAILNMHRAIFHTLQFQREYCSEVLTHVYEFTSKAAKYAVVFSDLHETFKTGIYSSSYNCSSYHVYSKVSSTMLSQLMDKLSDALSYVQVNILMLKKNISMYKAKLSFFQGLQNQIKNEVRPDDILKSIVARQACGYLPNEQCTRFSLLTHISKVTPPIDCYYGYDMRGIRANTVTAETYDQQHICRSAKLQTTHAAISETVAAEMAPCRILKRVKNDLFSSLTKVVYYIVEHVLPQSTTCYWGYDLEAIKSGRISASMLHNARIGDEIFDDLAVYERRPALLMDASDQQSLYGDMCTMYGVCNSHWAKFIVCSVMHDTRASASIGCASVSGASTCIIGERRQGC